MSPGTPDVDPPPLITLPHTDRRRAARGRGGSPAVIRVLLAEDQGMMRSALATLLGLEDDLEVVGQVRRAADIVPAVLDLRPDVALLDIEFEDGSALDVAATCAPWRPTARWCSSPRSGDRATSVARSTPAPRGSS